ncbi:hypothetical protein [Nocardiopsis sp. YSL2]|uniref:hypothetical protein n=1 Tax=Nocardiopsis sp. YSL2 TaxID=2939492 RepID=UPI0026F43A10|nr:hypothetical protein [Nocardiopsis sp. YSL2]
MSRGRDDRSGRSDRGDAEGLLLRPDRRKARENGIVVLVTAVVVTLGVAIGPGWQAALASGAFGLVLFALVIGHRRQADIELTEREIAVRGLCSRKRRSRARAARVVRATLVQMRGSPMETLFVLDANGGVLLRMRGELYAPEDLDLFVRELGVPCDGPDEPVTANRFAKSHPGLVSWVERHPYLLLFLVTVIVVGAVMAGVVLPVWGM